MYTLLRLLNIDISHFEARLLWIVILIIFIFYRFNRYYNRYFLFAPKFDSYHSSEKEDDILKNSIYTSKLSDKIVYFLRRQRALRKCKKYTTKTKYLIKLKNSYLSISYLTEKKVITCQEHSKEKRILTINWEDSCENKFEYYSVNNIFEKMFDNICLAFNEKTTYDNVAPIFKNYFKTTEEKSNNKNAKQEETKAEEVKEIKKVKTIKEIKQENFEQIIVDINKASEEELTKLAGINIVKAKQIIEYRNLHKGFKSKEEYFEQMKIKKHFRTQQAKHIVLSEYKIVEKENNEERIIDF